MTASGLLAHAGGFGWDELVFLILPVVVLVVLARQARRGVPDEEHEDERNRSGE
ncbi:MAG TPA: hypothetical protein VF230_12845 [Acidimicrobiales bacterium]